MTHTSVSPNGVDALLLDYNGVLGLQPSPGMWTRLADLAEWPDQHLPSFQEAFWAPGTRTTQAN